MRVILFLACLLLAGNPALAHKASDSYLRLQVQAEKITGQWAIALRDLDLAIGLDDNDDGQITWAELRGRYPAVLDYALTHVRIADQTGPCQLAATTQQVEQLSDGAYASVGFDVRCKEPPRTLSLEYRLFFDLDPQHRGLLQLRDDSGQHSLMFSPDQPAQRITLHAPDRLDTFVDYFKSGVWHIAVGFDHILFVVTLLLPAVLTRRQGVWQITPSFKPTCVETCQVITAFTLAHSCTLAAASVGLVHLPGRWVESAIAASVLIAALNNVWPFLPGRRWMFAFGFGLIHGFGFAAVLGDVGLNSQALALSLLGFNLGVEAGQLALVALVLPFLYGLRATRLYRPLVHIGGSLACCALATIWLVERLADTA